MATSNTDEEDGDVAGLTLGTLAERVGRYPWPAGLATGVGAYIASYLVFVVYMLVGIADLPGPWVDRLIRVGFIHYNAHFIPVVTEGEGVVRFSDSLVSYAVNPLVYYVVPVVVIVAAAAVMTYWYDPARRDGLLAIATGLAMALGYLLLALVGTYLFTRTQMSTVEGGETIAVTVRPDRLATLLYGTIYPVAFGIVGSLLAQALLLEK